MMVLFRVFVLLLAGFLSLAGSAVAQGLRQLDLTAQVSDGYSRIVATWSDGGRVAPQIEAQVKGRVLVLRIPEPAGIDVSVVVSALSALVTQGRADADGRGARFALKEGVRVYRSTSVDRTAIDLVAEDSRIRPPAIVSPLVADRVRSQRSPELPELDVRVRVSTSGVVTQLAFYWPREVGYEAEALGSGLRLTFAARADPDVASIRQSLPVGLASFEAVDSVSGLVVDLTAQEGYRVAHSRDESVVVVALTGEQSGEDDFLAQEGRRDGLPGTRSASAEREELSGPRALRKTWLRGGWPSPVPGSGVVPVRVRSVGGGTEITLLWDTPVPAAIFVRAGVVWAVFGARATPGIDRGVLPSGFALTSVDSAGATVLRITHPKGLAVSAMSSGPDWSIRLLASRVPASRQLSPQRLVSDTGRPSIHTLLPGASGLVWFKDPVVGDMLAAAVAFGPSSALGLGRTLVEAELLSSAHGMGIVPHADDVSVSVAGETVIVSAPLGLAVSATDPTVLADVGRGRRYIDLVGWGGVSGQEFFARRSELEQRLSASDRSGQQGGQAFLDLARFYVGHDLGVEALGVLRLAVAQRPLIEKDARVLALRAVASIMAGRYKDSERILSHGSLAADRTVALWRGYAAAARESWRQAYDFFATGEEFLPVVESGWRALFNAAAAEAAYNVQDYERARRHARLASASGYGVPFERAALVLARLAGVEGDQARGYERLGEVAQMTSDPTAIDAELERLELGSELKVISARQIADRLEALRFRWRGDQRESRIVKALTDQYMVLGRYRDALATAHAANVHNPEGPGARALRLSMSEYFRRLFLAGEASRLDPVKALALFYEFRSLTPIGADGDRMVRKLAGRLIAFDLLDQAAELLQHQIDHRVRGPGRAAIAADLASIYLMNREYGKALRVIGTTRASVPGDLVTVRRLIEARALLGLERYDHAVELLEGVEGFEASWVRAQALWHDGQWSQVARELMVSSGAYESGKVSGVSLSDIAMRAAVAARMAGDMSALADLRQEYMTLFDGTPRARSFDLLTARTDTSGVGLAEAVRAISDMTRVDAFAESMGIEVPVGEDDPA